jgi:hypothetical protein
MKNNGDYEVSDVPALLKQWRDSRQTKWPALLQARAALIDAAGDLVEGAGLESRGMTPAERRTFDEYSGEVRDINADLAAYKAARIAEHGADQVNLPF